MKKKIYTKKYIKSKIKVQDIRPIPAMQDYYSISPDNRDRSLNVPRLIAFDLHKLKCLIVLWRVMDFLDTYLNCLNCLSHFNYPILTQLHQLPQFVHFSIITSTISIITLIKITVDSLYLEPARDQKICSRQREFEIEREKQVTAYTKGLGLQFEIERGSRQRLFEIARVNCISECPKSFSGIHFDEIHKRIPQYNSSTTSSVDFITLTASISKTPLKLSDISSPIPFWERSVLAM